MSANGAGRPAASYEDWQRDLIDRMRRGAWSLQRIAAIGGPSDETLRKMRDGLGARRSSWDQLKAALDALESSPEGDFEDIEAHHAAATVELHDIFGIGRVVVPVEDDTDDTDLEERIARVVRGIRKGMAQ